MMKRTIALVVAVVIMLLGTVAVADAYVMQDTNVTAPGVLPIVNEKRELTVAFKDNPLIVSFEDNYLTKRMEEITGVDLTFVLYPSSDNDANAKLRMEIAAQMELPDMIWGFDLANSNARESYGQSGAIIPLNDLIDNVSFFHKAALDKIAKLTGEDDMWLYGRSNDGNIWAMMGYYTTAPGSYHGKAWYNTDFAEALGMSSDSWENGVCPQEWLLQYLRGVRDNDVNGNGDPNDEIPITGRNEIFNVVRWFLLEYTFSDCLGGSFSCNWINNDGVLTYNFDKEEFREGLRFVKSLYDEKIFDDSCLTQDKSTFNGIMQYDPCIVGIGVSGSCSGFKTTLDHYKPIAIVEGPDGQINVGYNDGVQGPRFESAISSSCDSPEMAFRFLDAMSSDDELSLVQRWGRPEIDWRYANEDEVAMYDFLGYKPLFAQVQAIWGVEQSSNWGWNSACFMDVDNLNSRFLKDEDPNNNEYLNALALEIQYPYVQKKHVPFMNYTTEENEMWSEVRSSVNTYVQECMALFATGKMDIEKDWDAYLAELTNMGAYDLLAADQEVYNRTYGINQ